MDEEEEEGGEGSVRDRPSSPTSAEIDLLVHIVEYTHTIQIYLGLDPIGRTDFSPSFFPSDLHSLPFFQCTR